MSSPRLTPAEMSLGLRTLLAQLHAFELVDPLALYEWARLRLDDLRIGFYQTREPADNFSLWVRAEYLKRKVPA